MVAAALGGFLPLVLGAAMLFALGMMFVIRRIVKGKRIAIAQLEELRGGKPVLRIDAGAVFFGVKSVGEVQARGNGLLSLLEHELVFTRLVPAKTWRIPLTDIVAVSHPRWFLGKSHGHELLQIDWNVDGAQDSVAWSVPDLGGWCEALVAVGVPAATEAAEPAHQ